MVYIASIALAEAAASVLFQNKLASDNDVVQRLTTGFCKMFEQKVAQEVERERHNVHQSAAQDQTTTAWD